MNASAEVSQSSILRTRIGVMTHLAPDGELAEPAKLSTLLEIVSDCINAGENCVVVDLSTVTVVNSVTLETLIDIQSNLVRQGGWLKIVHANALVRDIFTATGFTDQVGLLDTPVESNSSTSIPSEKPQRLGDMLVSRDLVSAEKVEEAIALQSQSRKRMGQILVDKGWVSEGDMMTVLGEQLSAPVVRLRAGLYDPDVVEMLGQDAARRLGVLPLQCVHGTLTLATSDPQAIPTLREIEDRLNVKVRPVLAGKEAIHSTLSEAYSDDGLATELMTDIDLEDDFELVEALSNDFSAIDELAEGSPIINLVNSIVQRAVRDGASDIHIEPSRNLSRIRFRIDGLLYEVTTLKPDLHPALISRLKVMANLDIAERRLPQDGRIQVHTQGRTIDLRFSSLPGLHGEKVVLRVLDKNQALLDINKLGFSENNLNSFMSLLNRSYGLVLVTGPTGSGKTTSLYAALNQLNSIEKNIVTIEDPVEYQLGIINQNEVRPGIGLDFSTILKHTLRQDPDIIMVGEIRERETAEIAIQAALTGHLVLSTLHTNHAIGAITRMIDMGVDPYLLSSALRGVVAQRLVRTVCPACKTEHAATPELIQKYGWDGSGKIKLAKGRGCPECYDSGYRGRRSIHEVLQNDERLERLITSCSGVDELNAYVRDSGMRTMMDDGLDRVRSGETTIEEITRVVNA